MYCFGTYFTNVEICDNVRVGSKIEWGYDIFGGS